MFDSNFEESIDTMPQAIADFGYWSCSSVFDKESLSTLVAQTKAPAQDLRPAKIGKRVKKRIEKKIRSDLISWQEPSEDHLNSYYSLLQIINERLRQGLFLPIKRTETQLALFPKGGFYLRHKDQHDGSANRLITLVFYLNENWSKLSGGELVLYLDNETKIIEPMMNHIVVFRSDIEHEVKFSNDIRKSLSSWFRRDLL